MDKKILIGVVVAFLIIGGIVVFKILQPEKPTVEEANVILAESIQNTLDLNSVAATGEGMIKVKDGETVLFRVAMEDIQTSIINPLDFTEQDSSFVFTYNGLVDFEAIVDFIERVSTPEELEKLRATGEMLGIDILTAMRDLGETNISVTMEKKSIDFDSYMKIVEIVGLREIVTDVDDPFMAEIEAGLGMWHKTPADPETKERMKEMEEASAMFKELMKKFAGVIYVEEVFENTKVNGTPVYNFALGLDLDKMKNVVISFVSLSVEEEVPVEEKEKMIAGINKNWPKIVKVIEAMEIDLRTYICQETRFVIKDTGSVNMNLHEFMVIAESIMQEAEPPVTPEKEAKFARIKEAIKNMSIVGTMNVVYSDHNAVAPILPPAEYKVIEPEPMPMW